MLSGMPARHCYRTGVLAGPGQRLTLCPRCCSDKNGQLAIGPIDETTQRLLDVTAKLLIKRFFEKVGKEVSPKLETTP